MFFTATAREMFCKNCGTQIPDDSKLCTSCGERVAEENVQTTTTPVAETEVPVAEIEVPVAEAQTPVAEPETSVAEPEVPVAETEIPITETEVPVAQPEAMPVFAQFEAEAPAVPAKKSKKFLAWLIPVIAVVVAAAVAAVLLLGPLQGWWVKTFGSDIDYRDYVQKNTAANVAGAISKAYGKILDMFTGDNKGIGAADINMKVKMGNTVVTLLEDLTEAELGEKIDMDWTKELELKLSANAKDSLQQVGATLNIGSEEIAVIDSVLDMDKGKLVFAILNLSDKYLGVDVSEYLKGKTSVVIMDVLQDPEMIAALPAEEVVDELLNKYAKIVLSGFDDVTKSTEIVTVGELEQKLTTLETKIDSDDLRNVEKAVLEELSKDEQVEKIIRRVAENLADQDELDFHMDADEVCDAFYESIDEALDELDALDEVDGGTVGENILLTQYINSDHEVVGYDLEVNNEQVMYLVEIKSEGKIAFEMKRINALHIIGEGTEDQGVVNADYMVSVARPKGEKDKNATFEMTEALAVSLVNFKAKGETVNGKMRLIPTSKLLDEMGLPASVTSVINLAKLQLELGFDTAEKSSAIEINVLAGEELLLGAAVSATEKQKTDISVPNSAYDIKDIAKWLEGVDTDKLLNALDKAGLPVSEYFYGYQTDAVATLFTNP